MSSTSQARSTSQASAPGRLSRRTVGWTFAEPVEALLVSGNVRERGPTLPPDIGPPNARRAIVGSHRILALAVRRAPLGRVRARSDGCGVALMSP
ncbi:hypothetical protein ASG43_19185 [Aureimonas sp. Leaf454]|nr:hypothetical protein ASG43_19185 [Aureimonas sp. Leaf454]